MFIRRTAFILALLFATASAAAQERPSATATKLSEGPTIDGDVLGDPAWRGVPATTGFWQKAPFEGQPASENTEVRIAYSDTTLFFGVVLHDREPSAIVISDTRRDSSLEDVDSFQIVLDTYLDRQNGFVFGTNAAGLEYDGQVSNEGQGTGMGAGAGMQQGGSGGGFNLNWDAAWTVRTRVTDTGWSAEFAIPFRSLRFPAAETHTWGVNFQRNIRRRNETAFWAPLPRQYNLYRLSRAGTLTGLQIPTQRNLQVTPYVLGQALDNPRRDATVLGNVGGDLKYSVTPSLTLDATYNTDFAQVEVDEQQINLDRFNLFFPEKRPFFLENAGLFSVGNPGEAELFFSRTIGISRSGVAIPIVGGARLSGKVGGTSVGVLNMQTEEVAGITPANNFTVGRVMRELPNRSAVGVIVTNRQGTGDFARDSDYGRTVGVDGRIGYGRNGLVSGWLAKTATPGRDGQDVAYKIGLRHSVQRFDVDMNFTDLGEDFNPEVGFLSRRAFRKADVLLFTRFRPSNFLGLQEIRPHTAYRAYWNRNGFQETGFWHIDSHWEFRAGHEVHTGMNLTREGVVAPFTIYPGVVVAPGTYDHREAQIVAFTNQGAPVSLNTRTTIGGFFGGTRRAFNPSLRLRAGDRLTSELSWQINDINLPVGSFVTNLGRLRVSYSFTPRLFVQSLVQYNDRADIWSTNLRFGWLQRANTGLFVVYNDTDDFGIAGRSLVGRSLILKFSRLIDLAH